MTDDSSTPRLLVVDDEAIVIPIVERFGRQLGFDVSACSDGREALTRLSTVKPHAVVLDLGLPGMDGIEVLRAIRSADPDCQVILMTGAPAVESAIEAMKLGALDYLGKPLDFDAPAHRADHRARGAAPARAAAPARRRDRAVSSSSTAWSADPRSCSSSSTTSGGWRRTFARCSSPARPAPARSWWRARSTRSAPRSTQALRHAQLLRRRRHAVRERAVRARARRVHRRDRSQGRDCSSTPTQRHDLPRRGRRAAAGAAAEAAARRGAAAKCSGSARSKARQVDVTRDRRHQSRPRAPKPRPAGSAPTCTTGSASSSCAWCRCASAARTFPI